MKIEVAKAIRSMKNGKATGPDDIPAELLKALDGTNNEIMTILCNTIYNSGQSPSEMKQSIFAILPKMPKTENCAEHKTISLMSHVTKLLLKIVQQRMVDKIDLEVSRVQSGFKAGTRGKDI